MTTLSVIIPAYNEAAGIPALMARVLAVRPALATVGIDELEVIVVDDGSEDRTPQLVATQPGVRLLCHAQNRGYGAALKTGFAAARGDWLGFLDADGTYPPEAFPALYQAADQQHAELVIGSRMAGAASQMPAMRRLGNLLFARLVSILSDRAVTDVASGMRLFQRTLLPRLYPLPDGLNFTPVMSTRALHEQISMIEVPIAYSERVGRSKLSVVKDGVRFAQSIVWTALHYNPMRPLGLLGLSAWLIAGAIGTGLIWARAQGITAVSPLGAFALFAALVLAVAGVSLVTLGMSFTYFVALFHKLPVQPGALGRPGEGRGRVDYFGWAGLVLFLIGLGVAGLSLWLGLQGWTVARLWLYYLTSACLALVGLQLTIAWIQIQVLNTLHMRADLVADDLRGKAWLAGREKAEEGLPIIAIQPQS